MNKESIVPVGQVHELLGIKKPMEEKVGLSVAINLRILNIKDNVAMEGKWVRVRDIERLLRVEASKNSLEILDLIADQVCGAAGLLPRRSLVTTGD